jgi:hypothetical protein
VTTQPASVNSDFWANRERPSEFFYNTKDG